MDAMRFDRLARAVAELASRRRILQGLTAVGSASALGVLGGGAMPGFGDEAAAKKRNKNKNKNKKKQCRKDKNCNQPNNPCKKAICKKNKCKTKNADNAGKACAANDDCCSGACNCFDPSGWATHPDADVCQASSYAQGFEDNLDHWYNFKDSFANGGINETFPPTPDVIERVASGTNGINAKSGDWFALAKGGNAYAGDLMALTTLGGFSNVFPDGGIEVTLDIYLDPAGTADGDYFAYSVALNQPNCEHLRDFVFFAGKTGTEYCVSTSHNVNTNGDDDPCAGNNPVKSIANAGWYTFKHDFTEQDGSYLATLLVLDDQGGSVGSWELSVVANAESGGNRYSWFPKSKFASVAIDNSTRSS